MRPGFAAEDGVALHFCRTRLDKVVTSRPEGAAYRVQPTRRGVIETRLDAVFLGGPARAGERPGGLQHAGLAAGAVAPVAPVPDGLGDSAAIAGSAGIAA